MEEKSTLWPVGFRAGVILALALIIYSMLLQVTGMATQQALSYLTYVFYILGIIWAHKTYKETGNGYMSYGQGLGLGMIVAGVGGVISSLFTYVYLKFIDDSMLGEMLNQSRRTLEERGMDDEQIEQAMAMSQKFATPEIIVIWGIFGSLLMGLIFALIISAFTKNNNPELQY